MRNPEVYDDDFEGPQLRKKEWLAALDQLRSTYDTALDDEGN